MSLVLWRLTQCRSQRGGHFPQVPLSRRRFWGMGRLFSDDGVQMPPNAPANVGRATIGAWSKGFMDLFRLQFALAVDEVRVPGEWAFERGTYPISLNPKPGGPPMQDMGKYVTLYQRKPGDTWRIARDIWNTSNPPPGR